MSNIEFPPLPVGEPDGTDWSYVMRREMQEIVPGLFLGPYAAAMKSKLSSLQSHNITHIVCIRQTAEAHFIRPNFIDVFKYLLLEIADCQTENIIQYIPEVNRFINEAISSGGSVLVHGNAGISRSAAFVIAYVMQTYGLPFKEAFVYVLQKRFCINPNEGFTRQLMEYEPIYKAKLSMGMADHSTGADKTSGTLKRKCQFDSLDCLHTDPSTMT